MKEYLYHELCMLFPPCSDEEFEALRDDIEKNDVREKVMMYEGKVLDGRNRTMVCIGLGKEPPTEEYTGDDPLGFVLSKNLHRRHLNESQRAMIADKLANLPQGAPKKNKSANLRISVSQEEAAKMLSVSRRSVQNASKLLKEADAETIKEVETGKKSVSKAVKELPTKPKVDPLNGSGPTPTEPKRQTNGLSNDSLGKEENDSESVPVPDPVLRANEKEVAIIAGISLIGRELDDYCDIAPEKMIPDATRRFIRAFCELFDRQDVKKVVAKL